jgi:predicted GNAT family acetyltransferase
MTDTDDVRVVDNPEAHRYEALLGDRVAGFAAYRLAADRRIFTHTEVDPSLEGRGIGTKLARGALDDVRKRGVRITVHCPFIGAYIRRHAEYEDLVASVRAARQDESDGAERPRAEDDDRGAG